MRLSVGGSVVAMVEARDRLKAAAVAANYMEMAADHGVVVEERDPETGEYLKLDKLPEPEVPPVDTETPVAAEAAEQAEESEAETSNA